LASFGPGKNARAAHPRRRDIFGVAVRNTNPRRIRRYDVEVENALPFDDFAKAAIKKAMRKKAATKWLRMKKPLAVTPAAKAGFENGSGMKFVQPRLGRF